VEEAKLDENYGQTTLEVKADSSFTFLSRSCVRRLSVVTGYLQNFTITGASPCRRTSGQRYPPVFDNTSLYQGFEKCLLINARFVCEGAMQNPRAFSGSRDLCSVQARSVPNIEALCACYLDELHKECRATSETHGNSSLWG
jgi:hypothetical protein